MRAVLERNHVYVVSRVIAFVSAMATMPTAPSVWAVNTGRLVPINNCMFMCRKWKASDKKQYSDGLWVDVPHGKIRHGEAYTLTAPLGKAPNGAQAVLAGWQKVPWSDVVKAVQKSLRSSTPDIQERRVLWPEDSIGPEPTLEDMAIALTVQVGVPSWCPRLQRIDPGFACINTPTCTYP